MPDPSPEEKEALQYARAIMRLAPGARLAVFTLIHALIEDANQKRRENAGSASAHHRSDQ